MRAFMIRRSVIGRFAAFLCLAVAVSGALRVLVGDPAREAREAAAQSAKRVPVYSVDTSEKKISISFDAAWGADKTEKILDILDEYGIKSTFFLVKFWVDKYPEMVSEIATRGHEIGNHSSTHPKMSGLTIQQMLLEVNGCAEKIKELTGIKTTLFRPPYGDYSDSVISTLEDAGYTVIQWSKDSLDWKSQGVTAMVNQVTKGIKQGDIVLFHNNSDHILEALPIILDNLITKNGYTIVPVGELIIEGESYVDRAGVMRAGVKP